MVVDTAQTVIGQADVEGLFPCKIFNPHEHKSLVADVDGESGVDAAGEDFAFRRTSVGDGNTNAGVVHLGQFDERPDERRDDQTDHKDGSLVFVGIASFFR